MAGRRTPAAPHELQELVLGALGGARVGQVRQRGEPCLQLLFDLAELLLERLGARGNLAHRRDLALALLLLSARADARARLVLLRAQPLELGQQRAPPRVELEHLLERAHGLGPRRASAARAPSGSSRMRLRSSTRPAGAGSPRYFVDSLISGADDVLRFLAGVGLQEVGDLFGLLADDDVLGHDRAGESAVADRVEDVFVFLLALVEVRPLRAQAVGDRGRRALGADRLQRVAARAAFPEDHGASVVGAALGDFDARRAAGAERAAQHSRAAGEQLREAACLHARGNISVGRRGTPPCARAAAPQNPCAVPAARSVRTPRRARKAPSRRSRGA